MEVERIGDAKVDGQLALPRLASRRLDGGRRDIDADDLDAVRREHQGVLAGSAPAVEEWPSDHAGLSHANEGWLRPTDVPGRPAAAVALIPLRTRAAGVWL